MSPDKTWKTHLYEKYITSGQGTQRISIKKDSPYFSMLIRQHLPANHQVSIVDLGCGYGAFLLQCKRAGYINLVGVDISSEQVELAHRLGADEVVQGELISYVKGISPGTVDVLVLLDILEHFTREELFEVLSAALQALQANGELLIHVPNAEGLFGMRIRYGDLTHEIAFTPRSISQALTTVGFHRIQCLEDRPLAYGIKGRVRRFVWQIGTLPVRLLMMAETGSSGPFVLSQNMLIVAHKPTSR